MGKKWNRSLSIAIMAHLTWGLTLVSGAEPNAVTVEITTRKPSIRVGEPMVIKMTYRFREPQLSRRTGEIYETIGHMMPYEVTAAAGKGAVQKGISSVDLNLTDRAGLEYSGPLLVWFSSATRRLEFTEPGEYILKVYSFIGRHPSNPLHIVVSPPSPLEQRSMSVLSEPNDYMFIEAGLRGTPQARAHLEQVVQECQGSVVAQLCAARLGLVICTDIEESMSKTQLVGSPRQPRSVTEVQELVERARPFLTLAAGLPDEFPVREEVLYRHGLIEYVKGDKQRAATLIEEAATKYPNGKWGKLANNARRELIRKQTEPGRN